MIESDLKNSIELQPTGLDEPLHPGDLVPSKQIVKPPTYSLILRFIGIFIAANWFMFYCGNLGVVVAVIPLTNALLSLVFVVILLTDGSDRRWWDILFNIFVFVAMPVLLVGGVFLLLRYTLAR